MVNTEYNVKENMDEIQTSTEYHESNVGVEEKTKPAEIKQPFRLNMIALNRTESITGTV